MFSGYYKALRICKEMESDVPRQNEVSRKVHSIFIFMSCFLIMVLHIGFINSIGTLFTDIMGTFNSTRAETAVIQSTTLAVTLGVGIFIGALITKIGLMRTGVLGSLVASFGLMVCFFTTSVTYLIISIGVFSGVGFSCVFISSAAALSDHFSGKRRYIYLSMHATGAGIGGMIYPYLIRYLSDLYGFRGALLIIGAISMNTVPGCILWRQLSNTKRRPENTAFSKKIAEFQTRLQVKTEISGNIVTIQKFKQKNTPYSISSDSVYVSSYPVLPDETKTKTVTVVCNGNSSIDWNNHESGDTFCENIRHILRNKSFLYFVIGMLISAPSLTLVLIFIADIYVDKGLTKDDVSLGLLLLNVLGIVGRLLPGILLQCKCIPTLSLPLVNAILSAVLIFFFAFVKSRLLMIVLSGAIGIPLGMCISMFSSITLKLVGSNTLPTAMGMFFTLNGIGQVVSGPINGYIRDVTGSYTVIFYISAGIHLFGAIVFFGALITRRKQKHNTRKHSSVFHLTNF